MDPDSFKKQNIKVIISEVFMVIAVIITVIVLALLVSGYWLNSNFEIERNGMLQISSIPTGASVEIDGQTTSWLERTNSSKILSSGSHTIRLTKDGYDSWSKTVNISEGLLYRLHYPRLFLEQRQLESVADVKDYTSAFISSDHNAVLLVNNTSEWSYINLDADEPASRKLDVSNLFAAATRDEGAKTTALNSDILEVNWDYDASHVLIKSRNADSIEWVLLDIHNVDKSINLTKEFGADFSHIEIIDNNSNNLLAVRDRNLHRIDVPGRSISAVIVKNVTDFDHYNNEVVFSAQDSSAVSQENPSGYYVGYFGLGDRNVKTLGTLSAPAKVVIGKFYESEYIATLTDNVVTVHQKEDYAMDFSEYDLSFSPNNIKVGHNGEFLLLNKENSLATLDFEAESMHEWVIENDHYGWIDNDMLYVVSEGSLIVYDFDGLNRRVLAHSVSDHFPAVITNDRWLYYFSDGKLVREWLVAK